MKYATTTKTLSRRQTTVFTELKSIIALAVPLVAGLTSSTMLGLVDTYMLGDLGEAVLGAVSLTNSILLIFYAGLYGFMGPIGILVGQAFGGGNTKQISSIMRHGVVIAFFAGLASLALMVFGLFVILPHTGQPADVVAVLSPYWLAMGASLLPYSIALVYKQFYDSIDRPWLGFILTLLPVGINIFLNWVLIKGNLGFPALGIMGAGLASLIAQTIGVMTIALHYRWSRLAAPYREIRPWSSADFRTQWREGWPMSLQYLLEGGAVAVAGILIGWLGTTALAANQIVYSVTSVLYMLPLGMSAAVSIRVAQAAGGGQKSRAKVISYTALAVVTVWSAGFTGLLLFFGRDIAAFFVNEATVIGLASATFISVGLMQIFDGLQSVSLGALRGILDNRWPTRVSLIGYWLIALPTGYVLGFVFRLGAPGFWGGFGFGLAVASVLLLRRIGHKMV
jgi:multidrug resistance protein, MATE family